MPARSQAMFLIPRDGADSAVESRWKAALAENAKVDRNLNPAAFAEFMLNKTSRTFALNIKVLPPSLRNQVQLAYLLCRMADTLEDDAELDPVHKINLIKSFRLLIPPSQDSESRCTTFRKSLPENWAKSERWDRLLVAHSHWILPLVHTLPQSAVKAITDCVEEMCEGMIRFTSKQAERPAHQEHPVLIETEEDLDRYCYYVAGTVGHLLCKLFALHSPLISAKRAQALNSLAVSFGLGLQLTNILKDIHEDAKRGISYIPLSLLAQEDLSTLDFLSAEGRKGKDRIMIYLIQKAKNHLKDALEYTCLLPRLEPRMRLFCLWPLFMAAETIVLISQDLREPQMAAGVKISRTRVKRIVWKTSLVCWSNSLIRHTLKSTLDRMESTLANFDSPLPMSPKADMASGMRRG